MKRNRFKILNIGIFLLLICYFYFAVNSVEKSTDEQKFNILIDALNRSVVQCYAIEGFYPPNIEYLENNYGLVVDYDKYVISYSVFASNIMPEIDVFSK